MEKSTPTRFSLINLGCAKNQVDAEGLIHHLEKAGYQYCTEAEQADFLLLNTCCFIESAREEAVNTFFEYYHAYPDKKIIVCGCMAQHFGKDLLNALPEAAGFFGNRDLSQLPLFLEQLFAGEQKDFFPRRQQLSFSGQRKLLGFPGSAYVKIAEGCIRCCSYCSIPQIRGPLQSRHIEEICLEVQELLDRGIFEINLIAQDLASYGEDLSDPAHNLKSLLESLLEIKKDFWLRLLYIHPDHFPMDILPLIKSDSRLLPYFDLPFQHASPRILKHMNRSGSAEKYLELLSTIRNQLDPAVFRSTLLLGFPGETEEDLQQMEDFIKQARLDWLGFFVYSVEENTAALKYRRGPLVSRMERKRAEKYKERFEVLQQEISSEKMQNWQGKKQKMLIEENISEEDLSLARCWFQAPEVDGITVLRSADFKPGQIVEAQILRSNGLDLEADYSGE